MSVMFKKVFSLFDTVYWRYLASSEKYARHIGVTIGENCLIATRSFSTEPYLVTIGNNVQLTNGVSVHTHGGGQVLRAEHPDFDAFGKVVIKDWAYVGAYSQIMPGVTIGEGALVAAGSVVTKSVAPHTVVGGNPARFICTVDEYYERNKHYNIGTKGLGPEEKKKFLLGLPESSFITK